MTNFLGCGIRPASLTEESGLHPGFLGPCGLPDGLTLLFDRSLENANNLCCGANREGFHYTGLDLRRELGELRYEDFAKLQDEGICPRCGRRSISISRGIEVGNIFQLGAKYTEAMGMRYLDREGNFHFPLMGCYGIGIGRLAASVCEARHDEFGPVWPLSIAPWQAHLCAVRAENPDVKEAADRLYGELQAAGVETLYDDRPVSAGVQFSDADLLGVPFRVVVSPRNLREGYCEIAARDHSFTQKVPLAGAAVHLLGLI